jgi:hypothetical protein
MNRLILEIGFGELLLAVVGAGLVGVLLMMLYHRLAMRRERELHLRREEMLELRARALEASSAKVQPSRSVTPSDGTEDLNFHR